MIPVGTSPMAKLTDRDRDQHDVHRLAQLLERDLPHRRRLLAGDLVRAVARQPVGGLGLGQALVGVGLEARPHGRLVLREPRLELAVRRPRSRPRPDHPRVPIPPTSPAAGDLTTRRWLDDRAVTTHCAGNGERSVSGSAGPSSSSASTEPDRAVESDETYLLSAESVDAVKVRDGLMDVKHLEQVDDDGLELWKPVMKSPLPLSADDARAVLSALRVPAQLDRDAYDLADLTRAARAAIRLIEVHKLRRHSTIGGCMAELTDLARRRPVDAHDRDRVRAAGARDRGGARARVGTVAQRERSAAARDAA